MEKKIWKFEIKKMTTHIPIPSDKVTPLWVNVQRNTYGNGLFVWVELIPDKDMQSTPNYTFYYIMTGDPVPKGATYIGSAEDPKTNEIVHVYWLKPVEFIEEDEFGSI